MVYKEVESVGMFHNGSISVYRYIENSTIEREKTKLRKEYGKELELIPGSQGNGISLVYAEMRFYLVRVE